MKIDRLISIIMIMLERNKITAPELAEMFEVNLRTIYRDIETINQAGIPIITYRGPKGGIGIMEGYKANKKLFTLSDISELLIGLNSIYSTMSSEDIFNVITKLKGLISEEDKSDVEKNTQKVLIDNTPWVGNEIIKEKLKIIRSAIDDYNLISFKYSDRLNKTSIREIEPYRLVLKNASWYVQGYCHMRKNFRIFAVSNMYFLKRSEETFEPRNFDYSSDNIYFRTERKTTRIKLSIHESLLDTMTELCGKENIKPYKDEKYIAYFPFIEDEYFYNMIIQFGDRCECLEPENIRNEIKSRIERLFNMYN